MLRKAKIRCWDVVRGTYEELLREMEEWRKDGAVHTVCFCDGNGLPRAWWGDKELRAAYQQADAVCADGIAVDFLAKMCSGKSGRIIGPKLFPAALEYGVSRGWRHFFYGADEATLAALKAKMEERFPGVKIIGTFAPEFSPDPQPPPSNSTYDFLWVGLGCPKQEKWCARHKNEVNAPVLLAVGAAFDFLAGKVPETPEWVHKIGMCWFWRLLTGGRRVFVRNVKCVSAALGVLVVEFVRIRILRKAIAEDDSRTANWNMEEHRDN